ncbi:LmeA family phospholipid-binding protein [Nocardia sp. NPDC055321]
MGHTTSDRDGSRSDIASDQTGNVRPRNRRHRQTTILAGVVVVICLLAVGTISVEFLYRHRIENCVANQIRDDLGSDVSVDLGTDPVLLGASSRHISTIALDSDNARFGPAVDMTVHAQLDDVAFDRDGQATIGHSAAEVSWSNDAIAQTLTRLASDVASNPESGTLDVAMLGGLASVQVRPYVEDNQIKVDTVSSRGVPPAVAAAVVDLMTQSLGDYPLGMNPQQVTVTDKGVRATLVGEQTTLQSTGTGC